MSACAHIHTRKRSKQNKSGMPLYHVCVCNRSKSTTTACRRKVSRSTGHSRKQASKQARKREGRPKIVRPLKYLAQSVRVRVVVVVCCVCNIHTHRHMRDITHYAYIQRVPPRVSLSLSLSTFSLKASRKRSKQNHVTRLVQLTWLLLLQLLVIVYGEWEREWESEWERERHTQLSTA